MFAFSITFKLLSLYLGLRYGDAGPQSRPWIMGTIIGLIFAAFDVASGYHVPRIVVAYFAAYLIAALSLMHLYYRINGIFGSLLMVAVSTGVLFFGVPLLIEYYADR